MALACCQHREEQRLPVLNFQHIETKSQRGIFYVNDTIFSGTVYGLSPQTLDTAFVRSYQNGRKHSTWRQYYPTGRIREERYFQSGKKEGHYQAWWPNGNLRLDYHFSGGEYEGNCREWNIDGMLIKDMNYHRGYEQGSQKLWYSTGGIKSNYVMKNGRRYGLLGTKNCTNVTDSVPSLFPI
ncbi:MAG: toxin-antitoxin system YwqK family antitoxin [Tunicatimonas sp.]|uniref:toxin-antitoxin system YwqK family antitoxin n=1 Tax=Tunicatimonas sp. TaxID=1940096 RepID=UPI003C721468